MPPQQRAPHVDFGGVAFSAATCSRRAVFAASSGWSTFPATAPTIRGRRSRLRAIEIVAQGITINGLPLMTQGGVMPSVFDIDDLDAYYTNCVIGGPGAFMIPVNDWSQFPEAMRRKLMLELASAGSPLTGGGRNCQCRA